MPAAPLDVNLLERDELKDSPIGRIITWAITYGRYIMVTTEIVVLLAFISRFSLDRKLTDLKDQITQKQSIIEANAEFEQTIRMLQVKLHIINSIIAIQQQPYTLLINLQKALPPDVHYDSLEIKSDGLKGTAIADSNSGFTSFLAQLATIPTISQVELGQVQRSPGKGIMFDFHASLPVKLVPKASITPKPQNTQL